MARCIQTLTKNADMAMYSPRKMARTLPLFPKEIKTQSIERLTLDRRWRRAVIASVRAALSARWT